MSERFVTLISNDTGIIIMNSDDLRIRLTFERKGAKKMVPFNDMRMMVYQPDIEYLLKEGMVIVEDMQDRIDLGLEQPGTTEPTEVIALTDEDRAYYLTKMTVKEFKEKVEVLPYEQMMSLIDYAIANKILNIEKARILKSMAGIDIIKAISLAEAANEPLSEKEKESLKPHKPK